MYEDLTKREVNVLHGRMYRFLGLTYVVKPKCPDCGSKEIYAGPEAPGYRNVKCGSCNMKFNVPYSRGMPGQRLGK